MVVVLYREHWDPRAQPDIKEYKGCKEFRDVEGNQAFQALMETKETKVSCTNTSIVIGNDSLNVWLSRQCRCNTTLLSHLSCTTDLSYMSTGIRFMIIMPCHSRSIVVTLIRLRIDELLSGL